jgi:CopG-like RHH_1 or ribbon-helix-helix domain, RHH_5
MSRPAMPGRWYRRGGSLPELSDEGWERDDTVRRTIVLPSDLAERLAAEAERRGLSLSDLLAEYAERGLHQAR